MRSVSSIRVLLVDDDPLVRAGLKLILDAAAPDITVVAEAGDGDEVVAVARAHRPDVVLMDLRMARVDGIEATRLVRALPEPPHVIALTTWDVDDAVVRTLEAGASGFLLKTTAPTELISAVRAVVDGDSVLSPRSTRQLLDHLGRSTDAGRRREAEHRVAQLTEREHDVVVAIAEGLTNAEAGARLYISEATVKVHLSAAQAKLGAANRVGVAVLAERAGLLRGR